MAMLFEGQEIYWFFFQEINERFVVIWPLLMEIKLQRKSYCVLLFIYPKCIHIHETRLKLILRATLKVKQNPCAGWRDVEMKGRKVGLPSCLKMVRKIISQLYIILDTFVYSYLFFNFNSWRHSCLPYIFLLNYLPFICLLQFGIFSK